MVIDTSALIAIALGEHSSPGLLDRIEAAAERVISSVSLLEAGTVLRARLGAAAVPVFHQLVEELGAEVVPFDGLQARAAIAAFGRFGKGMGHPAQLNFGDCAVYALAEFRGDSLLAMGNDFAATDLVVLH
jgi:ribonuclease VapC